jgi:hypothetical protein
VAVRSDGGAAAATTACFLACLLRTLVLASIGLLQATRLLSSKDGEASQAVSPVYGLAIVLAMQGLI